MNKKATYLIVFAALIAGTNGILIKHMPSMTVGAIAWFRTAVPVVILLPFLNNKKSWSIKTMNRKMLLISTVNALRLYVYLIAYAYTSIGNAVVLFYTYPIVVLVLEYIILKEKLKMKQLIFILLAFLGILITYIGKPFDFQSNDFLGMMAALAASVGYAFTIVLFKSEIGNYTKNQLVFNQNVIGAILFIPFLTTIPSAEVEHMGIAIIYGALIGIVVFKLFFYGLKYLPAATATSLMYIEVISAILLGYFILNETLAWNMILGGMMILGSSYFIAKMKHVT